METIHTLAEGMQLIHNGNHVFTVSKQLSEAFKSGDRLLFIEDHNEPIHIPIEATELVAKEINLAQEGFYHLSQASDDNIDIFFQAFARNLADDAIWNTIKKINEDDVKTAERNQKSTTRLIADDTCRKNMIEGLKQFQNQPINRHSTMNTVTHETWSVELLKNPLGIVGFVFEGRPNVIADATGVLKSGNAVVFRVGQDALNTAKAIMDFALYPALDEASLSRNCIRLLNHPSRATAWALFSNKKLNLAVARGSGFAVKVLGSIANQHGVPVSLHGTGGAWMMTSKSTNLERLHDAIIGSLDRKVCNTLNTLCILKETASSVIPVVIEALETAGKLLNQSPKIHVETQSLDYFTKEQREQTISVYRASGNQTEKQYEPIQKDFLGTEWEWEKTPEVTLVVVESVSEAIQLFNMYSPQFVASFITEDETEFNTFFKTINAPFVGNGMTRWVDGQYALLAPELGLSNWESGRLLARSAILSGDSIYTTRLKMIQKDSKLRR